LKFKGSVILLSTLIILLNPILIAVVAQDDPTPVPEDETTLQGYVSTTRDEELMRDAAFAPIGLAAGATEILGGVALVGGGLALVGGASVLVPAVFIVGGFFVIVDGTLRAFSSMNDIANAQLGAEVLDGPTPPTDALLGPLAGPAINLATASNPLSLFMSTFMDSIVGTIEDYLRSLDSGGTTIASDLVGEWEISGYGDFYCPNDTANVPRYVMAALNSHTVDFYFDDDDQLYTDSFLTGYSEVPVESLGTAFQLDYTDNSHDTWRYVFRNTGEDVIQVDATLVESWIEICSGVNFPLTLTRVEP
jgi:hypothetical protein